MNVLMVASEAYTFVKSNSLGNVIENLSKGLKKDGVDIRVILPKYKTINYEFIKDFKFIKYYYVDISWRKQYCGILEYEYEGVTYYFIDNEYYFKREDLYGHHDDAERFIFFSRAILEMINEGIWIPDVIHCNDWQTGMLPLILEREYKIKKTFLNIKTVFSIHNLAFQGNFPADILPDLLGYDYHLFNNKSIELYNRVSFIKAGINFSNQIITVSENYSREIRTEEFGEKLDGLLNYKSSSLKGITNGINYDIYNPKTDRLIFKNYCIDTINDKYLNKVYLQKTLGLPVNNEVPIIAVISRLNHQKGSDLIVNSLDRILQKNVQVIILGTGEKDYEETFKKFNYMYRDKISVNVKFNEELAHKIYAGADILLMPSLFEPCGTSQLIALRYGTVPIVREVGGLKDTILNFNRSSGVGNGFTFMHYNSFELIKSVDEAIKTYNNKQDWNLIIEQGMKCDNSWERAAKEYKLLYKGLIDKVKKSN